MVQPGWIPWITISFDLSKYPTEHVARAVNVS
jgi:hypothetical protein